jgi:hypothetical protein
MLAVAAGPRLTGVQSGDGCTGVGARRRHSPMYIKPISLPSALQAQAFTAVQPLLAQVQCVGVDVDTLPAGLGGASCITALGAALRQNITQLCLRLRASAPAYLSGRPAWESLVDALPHVKVFQLRFQSFESERFLRVIEAQLLESAIHACQRRGR